MELTPLMSLGLVILAAKEGYGYSHEVKELSELFDEIPT